MARRTLVFVVAWTAGCSGVEPKPTPPAPVGPVAEARQIASPDDRLAGPSATGQIGDLRIANDRLVAVITKRPPVGGFAVCPGNLVDLAPREAPSDQLNEVFLYLGDSFPRQADYDRVQIVDPGGPGRSARIRASGQDTQAPFITIETDYILAPGQTWLTLETRFTSTATYTIERFAVGDAIQWGRTEHMAPGYGFEIAGQRINVDWIAGLGRKVSYALVPDGPNELQTPSGAMWSDPIGQTLTLAPGRTATYRRHVVVGRGDTASLSDAIAVLRGEPTGILRGRVAEADRQISDAMVVVQTTGGKLFGVGFADADGRYAIRLPPGRYRVYARAPGRRPTEPTDAKVRAKKETDLDFRMGGAGQIAWRITDEDGRAPPVRLSIFGRDGTRTPHFGPSFVADGAENYVFSQTGAGARPLSPGRYRVVVSRGPEYEIIDRALEVRASQTSTVQATLQRAFDTPGFVSADLHQHAAPSFDSGVSLEDRVIANTTEAVEVLVSTDHNTLTDYTPVIARLGLGAYVRSMVGVEATTHSVGHFNLLPLKRQDAPRGGMIDPEGMTPRELIDFTRTLAATGIDPFVQVNHPRSPKNTGYFEIMGLGQDGQARDPRYSDDYDGIEIVALGYPEDTRRARDDWFALLRRGRRITATGNSDTHTLTRRPSGWPRTYVCMDDDRPQAFDPKAFTQCLRNGCATVSAGPVVTIRSGETKMGGLTRARRGRVPVHIRVQAAGWVATDRLIVRVDGRPFRTIDLKRNKGAVRYDGGITVKCKTDCFIVAEVEADASLEPVIKNRPGMRPTPVGLTNPIYVDVDGDGRYR